MAKSIATIKEEIAEVALPDDRDELIALATQELEAAKTKKDVTEVWKKYYLKIGHRIMGRLLVGSKKGG